MRKDKAPAFVARRPGGSYNLSEFFSIIRVSYSHGCELINKYPDVIPVFYLGPGSPRIADATVERLQREGIPGVTGVRREIMVAKDPEPRRRGAGRKGARRPRAPPREITSGSGVA
jgi:hypothetical protein